MKCKITALIDKWSRNEIDKRINSIAWLHTYFVTTLIFEFDAHHSHHSFSYGLGLPRLIRNAAILNTNFSFQLI